MERHLFHQRDLDSSSAEHYARLTQRCIQNWDLAVGDPADQESRVNEIIRKHLDGVLVGPFMIAAKLRGLLEGDYFAVTQTPRIARQPSRGPRADRALGMGAGGGTALPVH